MPVIKKNTDKKRVHAADARKTSHRTTAQRRAQKKAGAVWDRYKRRIIAEREGTVPTWKLDPTEPRLKIEEAAERLGHTHWTLRRWAREGRMKYLRLGRRLYVPTAEIDRLLSEGLFY
jgi:excisionase family DNA binding protein